MTNGMALFQTYSLINIIFLDYNIVLVICILWMIIMIFTFLTFVLIQLRIKRLRFLFVPKKRILKKKIILIPPEEVKKSLKIYIKTFCRYEDISECWIEALMNEELVISSVYSIKYYYRKIQNYEAEIKNGLHISECYDAERCFLLWKYQCILEMIKRNQIQ